MNTIYVDIYSPIYGKWQFLMYYSVYCNVLPQCIILYNYQYTENSLIYWPLIYNKIYFLSVRVCTSIQVAHIRLHWHWFCVTFVSLRLSKAADMDHHWVSKTWLSDVGLPQYSQVFHNQLVDGRVLNSITRRDLEAIFNVTNKFHVTSILSAIQLLQMLNFDKEARIFVYTVAFTLKI